MVLNYIYFLLVAVIVVLFVIIICLLSKKIKKSYIREIKLISMKYKCLVSLNEIYKFHNVEECYFYQNTCTQLSEFYDFNVTLFVMKDIKFINKVINYVEHNQILYKEYLNEINNFAETSYAVVEEVLNIDYDKFLKLECKLLQENMLKCPLKKVDFTCSVIFLDPYGRKFSKRLIFDYDEVKNTLINLRLFIRAKRPEDYHKLFAI